MVGRHYANSETNCLHFLNSIGRWTIGRGPIFFVIFQRKHEIKKNVHHNIPIFLRNWQQNY